MPLYLTRFSYTPETWARLIKKPEDRRAAAQQYIESVGGKMHGFWFAFGDHDGYNLWEAPDNVSMQPSRRRSARAERSARFRQPCCSPLRVPWRHSRRRNRSSTSRPAAESHQVEARHERAHYHLQGIAGTWAADARGGGRETTNARQPDALAVLKRLVRAQNAHDVDAMLDCFDPAYRSEQPVHPARAFTGSSQVRKNWSALLAGIRGFRSEVLRTAVDGDTVWSEARWSGTKADGSPFEEMIVTIIGVSDGRIAWGRLYGDEVEREGADIDKTVGQVVGGRVDTR